MPRRRGLSELDARMYGAPQPRVLCACAASAQVVPVAATFEDGPYTLDSGDKLRIVVFGQDTLSNNYTVDAQGAGQPAAGRRGRSARPDHVATGRRHRRRG